MWIVVAVERPPLMLVAAAWLAVVAVVVVAMFVMTVAVWPMEMLHVSLVFLLLVS